MVTAGKGGGQNYFISPFPEQTSFIRPGSFLYLQTALAPGTATHAASHSLAVFWCRQIERLKYFTRKSAQAGQVGIPQKVPSDCCQGHHQVLHWKIAPMTKSYTRILNCALGTTQLPVTYRPQNPTIQTGWSLPWLSTATEQMQGNRAGSWEPKRG